MYGVAASPFAAELAVGTASTRAKASASSAAAALPLLAAVRGMTRAAAGWCGERQHLLGELCFDHADYGPFHAQLGGETARRRQQTPAARGKRRGERGVRP